MNNFLVGVTVSNTSEIPDDRKFDCRIQINDKLKQIPFPFDDEQIMDVPHLSNSSIFKIRIDSEKNKIGTLQLNLPPLTEEEEYNMNKEYAFLIPMDA